MRSREQSFQEKAISRAQTGWNRTLGAKSDLVLTDYGSIGWEITKQPRARRPNATSAASLRGQSRISFGTPPSPHRDPTVTPLLAQGHPKGWPRGLLGWWSGLHGDTCLSPGSTVQAHSNARHARRTTSDPFWDPFCDIDPEFLSITFRQFIAMTD
jgi:hypothetical protein